MILTLVLRRHSFVSDCGNVKANNQIYLNARCQQRLSITLLISNGTRPRYVVTRLFCYSALCVNCCAPDNQPIINFAISYTHYLRTLFRFISFYFFSVSAIVQNENMKTQHNQMWCSGRARIALLFDVLTLNSCMRELRRGEKK